MVYSIKFYKIKGKKSIDIQKQFIAKNSKKRARSAPIKGGSTTWASSASDEGRTI